MSYFEFPHTRSYEGDLGFVIKKVIELSESYDKFFRYNTIHFADPIEWNITRQYAPFTIVFDTENSAVTSPFPSIDLSSACVTPLIFPSRVKFQLFVS